MTQQFILSLDVGTHAVKAALINAANLGISDIEEKALSLNRISSTHVEQDACEIADSLFFCIKKLLRKSKYIPYCAGLACQRSTVVAWDLHSQKPLGPALSWQDTRARKKITDLKDTQEIQARSGLVPSPHYGASKLNWLQEHYSLNPAQHKMGPLVSYLLFNLLEGHPSLCDETNAARTQLLNINSGIWDEVLLKNFEIDKKLLPDLKPVCSNYGMLREFNIPLLAVCGDQNAACIACIEPDNKDQLLINLGTGAFILRPFPLEKTQDRISTTIGATKTSPASTDTTKTQKNKILKTLLSSNSLKKYFAQEGTVNGSGAAISYFCNQQNLSKLGGEKYLFSQLGSWLAGEQTQPCVFINTVGGLGSPFWQQGPTPSFKVISGNAENDNEQNKELNTRDQAIAVIESIVFLLNVNLDIIQNQEKSRIIYVSGGLSQLDGLCQRLANLSQRPVHQLAERETTLIGAARLAMNLQLPAAPKVNKEFLPVYNSGLVQRYAFFLNILTQQN